MGVKNQLVLGKMNFLLFFIYPCRNVRITIGGEGGKVPEPSLSIQMFCVHTSQGGAEVSEFWTMSRIS